MRLGSIAITKVFLETLEQRTKRRSPLNPWSHRDMFRQNQRSMRELILENPEDQDFNLHFMVEYLNEQKFNAYLKNDEGFLIPVILDAEINMNPDKPDSVLVRTDSEQYRVDYFIDKDGKVITLDYESSPYPIVS
jgi:hypothetical protein